MTLSDIAAWVSAMSAAAGVWISLSALAVSIVATIKVKKQSPDYAIVDGEGECPKVS